MQFYCVKCDQYFYEEKHCYRTGAIMGNACVCEKCAKKVKYAGMIKEDEVKNERE